MNKSLRGVSLIAAIMFLSLIHIWAKDVIRIGRTQLKLER